MITVCSSCKRSSRVVGRLMKVSLKSGTVYLCKYCKRDIKLGKKKI
ncbi:MAG: hypothetical protein QW633_00575 [Candidatus Aenigmatarchaeota archaeon]